MMRILTGANITVQFPFDFKKLRLKLFSLTLNLTYFMQTIVTTDILLLKYELLFAFSLQNDLTNQTSSKLSEHLPS